MAPQVLHFLTHIPHIGPLGDTLYPDYAALRPLLKNP